MSRVLVTQPFDPSQLKGFQALLGPECDLGMVSSLDLKEFERLAQDAEVLLNIFRPIHDELLQLAPHVKFVQLLTVGYDQLDFKALARRQILAANAPGSNTEAVAEHTILFMLSLLKNYTQAEKSTRDNKWEAMNLIRAGIGDLSTATVGLVGFGDIGRAVARRLSGFGSQIFYTKPHRLDPAEEERLGVHYASLPDLLAASTIVSLHLPMSEQNYHMLNAERLALMRPDALVINTSRGKLIDEQALREALLQGKIAGAGLDVLEHEIAGGNIFADLPQVVVTPHISGSSQQAFRNTTSMSAKNIMRFLHGERPRYLVFDPAASLPTAGSQEASTEER
ncbi:2-hydroxyacid dehydrogenase [Ktedonobacteria bacterium brp13]|nr:2-hydroxyacid dehydrogenase [Ktedonobacteria bacterium brp13]